MRIDDRALAVVLLRTQWMLDDAAHDIPAGRYSPLKHQELADLLEAVSTMVRERARVPVVVDAEKTHP